MPFEYRWFVPGRVILVNAYGDITLTEFEELARTQFPEQDSSHPLQTIMLTQNITSAPEMRHLANIKPHPSRGWIIFISDDSNPLGRFIATVVTKVMRVEMRFVSEIKDASDFLKRADPSLSTRDFPETINEYPVLGVIEIQ